MDEDTISLLDIILVLAKRWKFIFFSTFIAAVLILGYSVYTLKATEDAPMNFLVNYYSPEVLIRLQENSSAATSVLSSGNLGTLANLAGISSSGGSNADLAMKLLIGKTIVDQVVEEFDIINLFEIKENPKTKSRNKIKSSIETNFDSKTGILSIKYTDKDPILATQILNRLVELLEQRFKNLTMEKILNKKTFLEERLAQVDKELKEAQDTLIDFQTQYGIVDVMTSKDTETQMSKNEFVFSQYLPREKRHEITSNYYNLERDRLILQGIYQLLMQQYESAKIEEMDDTRTFQVIERAEIPEQKAGPSRAKICIIVTIAVFLLTVFLAFIFEYFEKMRKDPEESIKLDSIKTSFWKTRNKK